MIVIMFKLLLHLINIMPGNPNAPTKTCPVCNRPFAWRKKWERNWDSVVYCSRRCRSHRGTAPRKN